MSSTQDLDYPQLLFQYNNGFLLTKIMTTACELGVFDLLLESEEPLPSDVIAERLGTSAYGMEPLLEACVGLKLLAVEMKSEGEGKNQYERTFGISSEDLFEALYGRFRQFGPGMYFFVPKFCVTIYDLPKVVQLAKERFVPPKECRITFHEGDFFTDPIPEADLYIVVRVLHDWADDKCLELLSKIHKACKTGGGVLLVESLADDDKTGPLDSLFLSVIMLAQTEGKKRTPSEFRKLLTAAGFREMQVKKTGKLYDVILGRK